MVLRWMFVNVSQIYVKWVGKCITEIIFQYQIREHQISVYWYVSHDKMTIKPM